MSSHIIYKLISYLNLSIYLVLVAYLLYRYLWWSVCRPCTYFFFFYQKIFIYLFTYMGNINLTLINLSLSFFSSFLSFSLLLFLCLFYDKNLIPWNLKYLYASWCVFNSALYTLTAHHNNSTNWPITIDFTIIIQQ